VSSLAARTSGSQASVSPRAVASSFFSSPLDFGLGSGPCGKLQPQQVAPVPWSWIPDPRTSCGRSRFLDISVNSQPAHHLCEINWYHLEQTRTNCQSYAQPSLWLAHVVRDGQQHVLTQHARCRTAAVFVHSSTSASWTSTQTGIHEYQAMSGQERNMFPTPYAKMENLIVTIWESSKDSKVIHWTIVI
jgi:hypothetical protein